GIAAFPGEEALILVALERLTNSELHDAGHSSAGRSATLPQKCLAISLIATPLEAGLAAVGLIDLPALEELDPHRLAHIDCLSAAAACQDDPLGSAIGDRLAQLPHLVVIDLQQRVVPDHFHIVDIETA